MTDRAYFPGLELTRLEDWATCSWPHCRIVTGLGVGSFADPHCAEHASWVLAVAIEDALYEARGCVHPKERVCDRCARVKLASLDTIEAECGCVYSVEQQETITWCPEHDPTMGASLREVVSSS